MSLINKWEVSKVRFNDLKGQLETIIQNVAHWNKEMYNKEEKHWKYSEKDQRPRKRGEKRTEIIFEEKMNETTLELRH